MQKRLLGVLVGIALLTTLCINVLAAYADVPLNESTTEATVLLNKKSMQTATSETISALALLEQASKTLTLDTIPENNTPPEKTGPTLIVNDVSVANAGPLMVNDTTYISIRTMVSVLDPSASISWENGQLVAAGKGFHLTARPGDLYMVVNGRYLYVPDCIFFNEDATMAPIRTVCTALGASTQWEVMTRNITVTTIGSPITPSSSSYNYDNLYWLSRIIAAESRNQPLKGKIGVGTVIMNRVESPKFPDSVYNVIFSGNQFSPVKNGSIYNQPTDDSVIAAKLVLDGACVAGDSLFFNRAGLNCWAARNKTHITTIADHSFYV